ncbi:hypothetical protein JXD38_02210 [candidate division WOR-3 bacterium]|nr:hypothetical protein [candidate division WOR-3 bacterium]
MRRSLLGLLTVLAAGSLLVMAGCQRDATLRVVSINNGNALRSDLSDFYQYSITEDDETEVITLYQVMPDSLKVELQYVEIGAGLPTWTPYEALISEVTVKFTSKNLTDDPPPYEEVRISLSQSCVADASGKTITTFYMTPISAAWKQKVFVDFIDEDDPYYTDIIDLAEARITFSGYDSVAGRSVRAVGTVPVEFGNFFDDPSRFGK